MPRTATATPLPPRATSNLNLRVPTVSAEMLKEIATRYGTSVNNVASAALEFALAPDSVKLFWSSTVDELRTILVEAGLNDSTQLFDLSAAEWGEKEHFYTQLEGVGLIEELRTKLSVHYADRVICSFRLSMTGRIVAHILQGGGFNDVVKTLHPPMVVAESTVR